eukprot:TRINITY_DN4766_c0_g1_i1.p1 TRINITY_DN4766_c0_g1~~TRINITY_DN4766_c0_g1_i1.p1  ORF type:complete len:367 (+),score=75.21 TRINITY_DN4766_c0_g1_i1:111-1103(+)
MAESGKGITAPQRLRQLLAKEGCLDVPGVGDPLSARIASVELGFEVLFVSGFYVSAAVLGLPDADMLGYADMLATLSKIRSAAPNAILIMDGDTGYGGPAQVRRTVRGFGQAGAACVMFEDQEAPKQCGHTEGKKVVSFAEACCRVKAACDERDEMGVDGPLVLARTDARILGQDEARRRAKAYREIGADVVFLEAPLDETTMRDDCEYMRGTPTMVNLVEWSKTPLLGKKRIEELGYKIAIHPVTMLNASISAMYRWAKELREGDGRHDKKVEPQAPEKDGGLTPLMPFSDLQRMVGFPKYFDQAKRYREAFDEFSSQDQKRQKNGDAK